MDMLGYRASVCILALRHSRLVGGPTPYREALTARLEASGIVVDATADVDVLVICCTDQKYWDQAADAALWIPTVVVISEFDLGQVSRALALGAGVVLMDTPTCFMVDVIQAAVAGEVLLPLAVAQSLVTSVKPTHKDLSDVVLEGVELQIASGLLAGRSINQIANELNYSDRTIRRKLQRMYLKLGVTDRQSAIEALRYHTRW